MRKRPARRYLYPLLLLKLLTPAANTRTAEATTVAAVARRYGVALPAAGQAAGYLAAFGLHK